MVEDIADALREFLLEEGIDTTFQILVPTRFYVSTKLYDCPLWLFVKCDEAEVWLGAGGGSRRVPYGPEFIERFRTALRSLCT